MFTDKPTLPLHLETLLDVLKEFSDAKLSKKELGSLLQPPGIFDTKANINFTNSTINAAASLDLIKEVENISHEYSSNCLKLLNKFPQNAYKKSLEALVLSLKERAK